MRKNRLHTFSIILGSILAVAIAFSQYLTPECLTSGKEVQTEQADEPARGENEFQVSLPTFSLPVPVHVQPGLDAHFLFEIFFEEDEDTDLFDEDLSYADRFFETMFRVIISPNAP